MYKTKEVIIKDYLINEAYQLLLKGRKRKIPEFYDKYNLAQDEIETYTQSATELFNQATKNKVKINGVWLGFRELLLGIVMAVGVIQTIDFLILMVEKLALFINGYG